MSHRPYASGSHNRSYYRSAIPQTLVAPRLYNHHVTDAEVPAIQELGSTESEKCIESFKQWQSQKGRYDSIESGEKGLTMKISMKDFINFKKALNVDEDERFPRYSFNSSSSTLKFTHTRQELSMKGFLPASIKNKIRIARNEKFAGFQGRYRGSDKTPDAALKIESAVGGEVVKFVLEVRLSETYDMLVEDAKMWLEGRETVSAVMLIKIVETPDYKCPVHDLDNEQFSQLGFPNGQKITGKIFTLKHIYGPAIYKGLHWVGKITGFIEIWKRNPGSGSAVRFGDRIDLIDFSNLLQTKFWLSEFLDIAHKDDREIPFKWERCLGYLASDIKKLAADRCRQMLDHEGGVGVGDLDYQPSSSPLSSQ
ncbi:hypothetical protein HOY80DRAFT_1101749 [Tuber brumale]|nr:hypothetical protein HOY80DRAFT_1101749 [Tuber brumale]